MPTNTVKRTPHLIVIVLIVAVATVSFLFGSEPKQASESTPPAVTEYTTEQKAFIKAHIWQTLDRLTNTYPVEAVRAQLVRASIRANAQKEFKIFLSPTDHPGASPGYSIDGRAVWDPDTNKPGILFYVPALMRRYAEFAGHPESYEDLLIALYLHELFHVDHHPINTTIQLPYDVRFEQESEAWWDTAKNVLFPMVNGGRHSEPTNPTHRAAIKAYVLSGDDRNHPAWRELSATVTPR